MGRGLLGGEEVDAGEAGADVAPPATDPFATALAFSAIGADPDLRAKAGSYLAYQAKLAAIQSEHLHEQREVVLSQLKIRRLGDRLRLVTQVFLTLVTVCVFAAIVASLIDAFTSHSVVVNAFAVPPPLAERGVSGEVVASGVLDALQRVQAATRGLAPDRNAEAAWASDIKIEVPDTGISLGEIGRVLRAEFGHDLHIDGDVVALDGGRIDLTVRGAGVPARSFGGAIGDLAALTTAAAEYIYGRSQPTQYAVYLDEAGRDEDAIGFLPGAFVHAASDTARVRLAIAWGNALDSLNRPGEAVAKYRLAMTLAPRHSANWWDGWANAIADIAQAEGEEAAWRESKALLAEAARVGPGEGPARNLLVNPAQFTWDFPLELSAYRADQSRGNQDQGTYEVADGPSVAAVEIELHDDAGAARALALSDQNGPDTIAVGELWAGAAALDRGDALAAVAPLQAFDAAFASSAAVRTIALDAPCLTAYAEELAGQVAAGEAAFARMGRWSRCRALQGAAHAKAGDLAGARRIWAQGIVEAPDLPMVYRERALFEAGPSAAADMAAAQARAPNWNQ